MNEREESKMKPRLRAEEQGVMDCSGEIESEGLEILDSCWGSPISKNSVLVGFRVRRLAAIQEEMSEMIPSRLEIQIVVRIN